MSSEDMVGFCISIIISERLSANQRARYSEAIHVLAGHNSLSRRLMVMLISQPSSPAHKLVMFMLVLLLASQVRKELNHCGLRHSSPQI